MHIHRNKVSNIVILPIINRMCSAGIEYGMLLFLILVSSRYAQSACHHTRSNGCRHSRMRRIAGRK